MSLEDHAEALGSHRTTGSVPTRAPLGFSQSPRGMCCIELLLRQILFVSHGQMFSFLLSRAPVKCTHKEHQGWLQPAQQWLLSKGQEGALWAALALQAAGEAAQGFPEGSSEPGEEKNQDFSAIILSAETCKTPQQLCCWFKGNTLNHFHWLDICPNHLLHSLMLLLLAFHQKKPF